MKKTLFLIPLIIVAVLFSSGCIGNGINYTITTTITTTFTTSTTSVPTVYTTSTLFTTQSLTTSTTKTETSVHFVTLTTTVTITSTTGATNAIVEFVIYTIPVDNNGKPNLVTYVPVDKPLVYLTGEVNFIVKYYSPFHDDDVLLPMFSYMDLKYYSEHGFSTIVPENPYELISYLNNIFIDTPDPLARPDSYIGSSSVPINVLYDWFALNAVFRTKNLEYIYFNSTSVGLKYSTYYIIGYSVFGNDYAFSAHYNGTVVTVVSFYPGEPFATVIITPITAPGFFYQMFPSKYSFSVSLKHSSTSVVAEGWTEAGTWRIVRTVMVGTSTTSQSIVYFYNTLIVNDTTTSMRWDVFYESFIPDPLKSNNVFILHSNSFVIVDKTRTLTVSNEKVEGYWDGTVVIFPLR